MKAVRCRPAVAWLLVFMLALMSVLFLIPPSPQQDTPAHRHLASLAVYGFVGATLIVATWALWAQIVADERGLRWRIRGRWKSVYWDEITDYYLRKGQKQSETNWGIETLKGTVWVSNSWTQPSAFRDIVEERATRARARGWDIKGARDEDDWPRTFRYDTKDNRFTLWIGTIITLGFVLGPIFVMLPKLVRIYGQPGWEWSLAGAGMFALLMWLYALLGVVILVRHKDTRRRYGQQITIDLDRIIFSDGEQSVSSPWADVISIYTLPGQGRFAGCSNVVETRHGIFDYTSQIQERRLFYHLIAKFAPDAVKAGQRMQPDDDDLKTPSFNPARPAELVFTFRNRTTRALLWLPTALAVIFVACCWMQQNGFIEMKPGASPMPVGVPVLLGVGAALLWWRYYAARVYLNREGITQRLPFRTKTIAWNDVKEYKMAGEDIVQFLSIAGSTQTIRVWFGISRVDALRDEIAARAIHCESCTWEKDTSRQGKRRV